MPEHPDIPAVTFAELYRRREVEISEIDDFVDFWHEEYEGPLDLSQYLGMTYEDLLSWAHTGRIPVDWMANRDRFSSWSPEADR